MAADQEARLAVPDYLPGYECEYAGDPRGAAIAWLRDKRLGLFIHYNLASLLPHGKRSYLELVSQPQGDTLTSATELLPQFTAEHFDAGAIADLAVSAGMGYVNLTTRHLGGLYLFRTTLSDFTSLNSPAKRDLVGEMAEACRKRRLGLFLYVPPQVTVTTDDQIEHNHTWLRELLTQYGPVAGMWFDGINNFYRDPERYTRLSETYAFVRELQPQCLISFKEGATGEEDFAAPEHGSLRAFHGLPERTPKHHEPFVEIKQAVAAKHVDVNTTLQVGRGLWHNDAAARHMTPDEVWAATSEILGQGHNLTLNTGPQPDGSIHPQDMESLTALGERLRRDGWTD
ncbi:MAG: alpha-L-fucosidase [Armatimonadota bacterium]|jgi:alpha-L-fucosidase